jgi:gamma-tubulin complex component 5
MTSNLNLTSRPPSSFSRPSSSASLRPPSRQQSAPGRPASSLSVRPSSRIAQRPNSRLSRPPTRQSSRLLPLSQTLVTQITGATAEHDEGKFRAAVDFVSKGLEYTAKAGAGVDLTITDRQIRGCDFVCLNALPYRDTLFLLYCSLAHKARVNSRDELGEALEISYQKLKGEVQQHSDLDHEIKVIRII